MRKRLKSDRNKAEESCEPLDLPSEMDSGLKSDDSILAGPMSGPVRTLNEKGSP